MDILYKIANQIMEYKDGKRIYKTINGYDFEPIQNISPKNISKIAFFIGKIGANEGGTTSILRLGTYIVNKGMKVDYIIYDGMSVDKAKINCKLNLENYKGNVISHSESKRMQYDIIVATGSDTVFEVMKYVGYKMYFVQDYEPYFCKNYELFLLAKKTYEMGFHMVSLGNWNKQRILGNTTADMKIEVIEFPYEPSEYYMVERDYELYKTKKDIKLVVYIKGVGKRLPHTIMIMLKETKRLFKKIGINLNVEFFGGYKFVDKSVGKNLKSLSKDRLMKLYASADFGMVASMTNISLVPYEMLATGLPLIEFEDGSFNDFFDEDTAILTSYSSKSLFIKMKEAMDNPDILRKHNINAINCMKDLSWDKTCEQFYQIINGVGNAIVTIKN